MKTTIKIDEGAKKIIKRLKEHGYTAYIVGGCVRDSLLEKTPHDYDICTSAKPTEMLKIFADYPVKETGLQHGTITVLYNHEPYEITTYRIDGTYSDHRRPDYVKFTLNIIEDLERRDFTINAMAYNEEEGLIDPFHGLEDLKQKKIKCVGNPQNRFLEDPLRILRAIRLASQLEFQIESATEKEIHNQYPNLANISIERITSEFSKLALTPNFHEQLETYQDVFTFLIPELKNIVNFPQNTPYHDYDVFNHTKEAIRLCESQDLTVIITLLFHDIGKAYCYQDEQSGRRHFYGHEKVSARIADEILMHLKFKNELRKNIIELITYHDIPLEPNSKCIKKYLNKLGQEQFKRLLKVKKADSKSKKKEYDKKRIETIEKIEHLTDQILQTKECFQLKDLKINGNDLLALGIEPGKQIGQTLQKLLTSVINGEVKNTQEDLIKYAQKLQ